MSTNGPQRRRKGGDARSEALEAAREILLASGPSGVTLKAVGERMGVGHSNLIHHFGSAAGLQGALMDAMVRDLAESVATGLTAASGNWEVGRLLDVVFEAFGPGGASDLGAWLVLARETDRAADFAEVVRTLAEQLSLAAGGSPEARLRAKSVVLIGAYMAFADGLIGKVLGTMLETPQDLPRNLAKAAIGAALSDIETSGGSQSR